MPQVLFESARTHSQNLAALGVESAEGQQQQFSAGSALGKQHLHAGEVGAQERDRSIDNLVVFNPLAGSWQIGMAFHQMTLPAVWEFEREGLLELFGQLMEASTVGHAGQLRRNLLPRETALCQM